MNAILQAQTAYGAQTAATRTPRAVEYDTFARITHRLKSAAENRKSPSALASAIHDNRRLWTLLVVDVADDANPLPRELRAQIISLAEFTRKHSGKVLRDGAEVTPLIEINTAIMRGLSGTRATG
mgnify:CR=1 FL=1